jgi:hypothetical protein
MTTGRFFNDFKKRPRRETYLINDPDKIKDLLNFNKIKDNFNVIYFKFVIQNSIDYL